MTSSNNRPANVDPGYGKSEPSGSKPNYGMVASSAQQDADGDGVPDVQEINDLKIRVDALERRHINLNTDIFGMFEIVSAAPTGIPHDLYDQVKIYVNSTTYRLYWYDWNAHVWHYVTATA